MTSKPPPSHADAETTGQDIETAPGSVPRDEEAELEEHYKQQSTSRVALLLGSLFVNMFLVSLDRLIVSTAIPSITDEFNSLSDVGWYGSAYHLTACSFQLIMGKLYTLYSVRTVLLCNIVLFELGSAVCGAAPNSVAFIIGRAIAGVGSAGIFSGSIVCTTYAVPLEKRPRIQGLFGALFGLASILGPLIGGAFTSHVTWRWCFYINIPFGGLAMVLIPMCLRVPDRATTKLPWTEKLLQLDGLGISALIPSVVALLLALQWGGETYAWNNPKIIALLTLAGVLAVAFVAVQIFLPKTAMIPPRIFNQRSIIAGSSATFFIGSSLNIFVYFLSIWFQSITGVSAIDAGIRLLPLLLSMVVTTILNGFAVQKTGYYTPSAIVGACIMSVGAGLLTTLEVDTAQPRWIGYQVLYGLGLGLAFQAPNLSAQSVLPTVDVPVGISLMFFSQLLGAAIFISVGENVLGNQLVWRLAAISGFDTSQVTSKGATSLLSSLPEDMRQKALVAYNESLREVFRIGLIVSCLAVLGVSALEWRSVLKKGKPAEDGEDKGKEGEDDKDEGKTKTSVKG